LTKVAQFHRLWPTNYLIFQPFVSSAYYTPYYFHNFSRSAAENLLVLLGWLRNWKEKTAVHTTPYGIPALISQ
jgi:hypothetical protein